MSSRIGIIKTGTTHPRLRSIFGDFETWFQDSVGHAHFTTYDVAGGVKPPPTDACDGFIVTGSPAMVTEKAPWSENLKPWLMQMVEQERPVLAVCYGHQLLAEALGGEAGWHPKGREIGTVAINLTQAGKEDLLLSALPATFSAQVTHAQSALKLPPGATLLASNQYEPHQAYRVGSRAWSVQFHPEFTADIMRGYIFEAYEKLMAAQIPVKGLLAAVDHADANHHLVQRFVDLCD
ncbi:MAG: GMP synthase [Alcanivorax sp.]|jgi:GMP synthase (glutamine-hydrolysing)|uniref:glutamine amidotransferase n=1 Tax=unclassified Ketobacter TaxID=2639109 RepID=UPI000C634874|nr:MULTISPECIES: glutamine amidotransferase [unclassified Ketobacter]MBI26562.1 GMP synthase [Pseudomonadales bacterium]MEC8810827.1 glutamine amidotransferase [Pseudomonadota bacterium]TNC89537.1 MAG: GMP synthase [Alcanivorax sp.]HBO92961.1 glutamine amidotransferase [Gammaproteobacteria bacterium]RLT88870.1 MAG: glutamine amidotransferase [Ketobacter sp. GenoA1]|tara:strand:- start:525 stop:1232 length:708 start_codon:yes stop_codon:yes gene_type:complete